MIAILGLAGMLPSVILGASFGVVALMNERSALLTAVEGRARYSAALVGQELASDKRATDMMAQSPAFDGGFDADRFAILAGRIVRSQPEWRRIRVSEPSGRTLLEIPAAPRASFASNVIDLGSFRWAVDHQRPDIGRVVSGHQGTFAFPVRAPVVREGQVTHLVTTVVPAATLTDLLLEQRLPADWYAEVVDGDGKVVASAGRGRPPVGQTAARAAAAVHSAGHPAGDGISRSNGSSDIATGVPVPATNWTVYVGAPSRLFLGPWYRAVMLIALAAAVSLVLSLVLLRLLIRELRQARLREAHEVQAQRMEALGRLTGGIAHDFNNLLTPILGGLDLLKRRLGDDPRSMKYVDAGIQSAERARTLVGRLLAYSRRQALVPKAVDVNRLVADLMDLLRRSIGPTVTIDARPGAHRTAFVDPAQLELAILNLAINARDAMPDGGSIVIETGEADPDSGLALPSRRHVYVAVSDTGVGMDAATLRSATEPFFTTKPVERGTGLGLSMVQGFAAQSGGALELTSRLGEGTRATIWLSGGEREFDRPAETPSEPRAASPGEGDNLPLEILLVDDEPDVRSVAAEALRALGHAATEAGSMLQALACLAERRFDLLVTDYVMPGGSGAELVRRVRLQQPGMGVVVLSGYIDSLDDIPADVPRLAKPFSIEELKRLVDREAERIRAVRAAAPKLGEGGRG